MIQVLMKWVKILMKSNLPDINWESFQFNGHLVSIISMGNPHHQKNLVRNLPIPKQNQKEQKEVQKFKKKGERKRKSRRKTKKLRRNKKILSQEGGTEILSLSLYFLSWWRWKSMFWKNCIIFRIQKHSRSVEYLNDKQHRT